MTSSSRNDLPLLGCVIHETGMIRLAVKKLSCFRQDSRELSQFLWSFRIRQQLLESGIFFQALSDVSPGTSANHLIPDATRSTPAGGFPVFHIRGIVTLWRLNFGRKPLKFPASSL